VDWKSGILLEALALGVGMVEIEEL